MGVSIIMQAFLDLGLGLNEEEEISSDSLSVSEM